MQKLRTLKLFTFPFTAMGTSCTLFIYSTQNRANKAAQYAISEARRIEARYSRYRSDSVLSKINRAAEVGASVKVDEETAAILDYAYSCYLKSGGLFDITSGVLRRAWDFSRSSLPNQQSIDELLPLIGLEKIIWESPRLTFTIPGMEMDFGGICKEYASDRAADLCKEQGIKHGLVDLGGDITVIGPIPDDKPWHIEIRNPETPDTAITTVDVISGSLATSGNYERYMDVDGKRYCHILNPLTGWPVFGLSSVSVLAPQCLIAGSVSTIAMLKEKEGIQWLSDMGLPHVWVDDNGVTGKMLPELISL
ncbi:MAG: FAD:protein FMN transferase [Nitrospirae bacterium]|nr:FAD:protein FMN transferase [Nitrospirota bacterium]MBF0534304.1 FAD:protein FMN transferase [Nitrospirota bacterium]MBF0615715.1 FAD:protein FMN transferase [Nitrospirota bacterium]